MNMQETLETSSASITLARCENTSKAVVFLPGISGKAYSDRFLPLENIALEAGYSSARVDIWGGEDEVHRMSITTITQALDEVFLKLTEEGYNEFALIGKSFGGGMSLLFEHTRIVQKILWAPAIGSEKGEGNIGDMHAVEFGNIADLLDIKVGSDVLSAITVPITIIHGTKDTVMPVSNSEALLEAIEFGFLEIVDGADHSFKSKEAEEALMQLTKKALTR